ncbi:MAG: hypothetical protein IPF99_13400 [Deltaproteobacteria bacterium]|nr:hypothetical protein [Deltaproteobacteria bacterium]
MQERERVESALIAAYALPVEATGVVISLDRVAVPMEEPRRRPRGRPAKGAAKRPVVRLWHMAYCATVTIHDASGKGCTRSAMGGCRAGMWTAWCSA